MDANFAGFKKFAKFDLQIISMTNSSEEDSVACVKALDFFFLIREHLVKLLFQRS